MHVIARTLASLALVGALAPATALAEGKQACLTAYEETQKLRKAGKLLDAKKQSLVCAQDVCPAAVRDDCTQWAVDIEKSTPTVVLVVTDDAGNDVTDAVAYVDGEKVAHADGKSIALDPGKHTVRVEREGFDTIEQEVVAHEGDKNRKIAIKFGKKPGADGAPVSNEPQVPATSGGVPTATWVFSGLAVVGVAGFAAFGLMGKSKVADLDARNCKPACPQDEVDSAKRNFLLADVSLGVAVLSAGLAVVFYATREEPKPTAPAVSFAATPHGGGATLRFSF